MRAFLKRTAVLATLVAGLLTAFLAPARAAEQAHEYTPQNPEFIHDTDGGRFVGRVSFDTPNLTYAWGVGIAPQIVLGIVGPVTENTVTSCEGKVVASSHHVEPADYIFHGSSVVDTNCPQYTLDGTLNFMYRGAVGTIIIHDSFVVRR
ncbi:MULTISPECIES: hypothetical protein [Actinomycetes]|uniref:hypothetical protein n=1 Tax=Actinomycetes TaxID=1760 RepID=UPI0001B55C22|nr:MULTISPECIES: hypothetical protein [Actinomycetes]EFL12492.1 predicted protein [Streptomyces sp. AA4]